MKMLSEILNIRALFITLFFLVLVSVSSCSDDPIVPNEPTNTDSLKSVDSLRTLVSADITNNVILPTYLELRNKTAALRDAAAAYSANPIEANWLATRAAWYAARSPWESSEAFIFGPADFKGLDPALDLWPLNRIDLDSILVSDISLTVEAVAGFNENVKGSHTAEYLLFGDTNQKVFSQMTPREIEYLVAVTADIAKNTEILYNSWVSSGENYAAIFEKYPNSRYPTPKDGISEMIVGMIDLSVELYDTKMQIPYTSRELKYDESAFSDNSVLDFQENLNCIKRMYTGENGAHTGKGLTHLVQLANPSLDVRVREKITNAEIAVSAITPTFGKAITSNRPKIAEAITAVESLYRILEDSVKTQILR
jgi:putative iron-regulated protein